MKTLSILLIEDNPDDAELTRLALKRNGYEDGIIHIPDGLEALDFLLCQGAYADRDPKSLPRLTLLDLKLPKFNGFQVLQKIRENEITRLLPVVIMSSSKERSDIQLAYKLGASGYVHKTIDFRRFSEIMHHLSEFWLKINEPPPFVGDAE